MTSLTFLLYELVEQARLAHAGIADHKELEQIVCNQ